jgi:hypothetical protein
MRRDTYNLYCMLYVLEEQVKSELFLDIVMTVTT